MELGSLSSWQMLLALLPVVASISLLLKKVEQESCQLISVRAFVGSDPQKSHQGPPVKKRKDKLNTFKINRKHLFLFFPSTFGKGKATVILVFRGKAEMLG